MFFLWPDRYKYLDVRTQKLSASCWIIKPIPSHKSFYSTLLKHILIQMAKGEKGKRWKNRLWFPPTEFFSFRMILIMNGCPEESKGGEKGGMKEGEEKKIRGIGVHKHFTWNYDCPQACACAYVPTNTHKRRDAVISMQLLNTNRTWTCSHMLPTLQNTSC